MRKTIFVIITGVALVLFLLMNRRSEEKPKGIEQAKGTPTVTDGSSGVDRLKRPEEPGPRSVEKPPALMVPEPKGAAPDRGLESDNELERIRSAARSKVEGDPLVALRMLSAAYPRFRGTPSGEALLGEMQPWIDDLYFSRKEAPEISFFTPVRSGDTLDGITRRLRSEKNLAIAPGLIMKVNGIQDARRIRAGSQLKVLSETVRIEVFKSLHRLEVFFGDVPVLTYPVGLGKGGCTPEGTFEIATRQVEPVWFNEGERVPFGDPRNVLGTRWLGFADTTRYSGYGIHGTWDPSSIGKDLSEGCVRMENSRVEELFTLIPRGTRVTIHP